MEYGLVIWWLVAYLAFMAVGMPLASALFPRLADRGASMALPVALAVVWVVAYLVGHLSLTAGLWAGLAVLAVAAAGLTYRDAAIDRRRYAETAVVFTIGFLLMVAIRSVDAGVHPTMGEKFLDFGLLQTLLRADALPPEDMWFAGRPVKYYYGGHLLAALLTRVTGTEARYAYNLALAGFYGMLVTAAYGLAGSVAASRGVSRVRAGAFGAFFVGFAGNLSTAGRFLIWAAPGGLGTFVADTLGLEVKRLAANGPDAFFYWTASRVIDGTINEFPLFAWLNGDMHAHMMSTPFVLLVAAVFFSYYRTPASETTRRRLLVLGVVPPLAGLLGVVNTWSFPTVGGLTFLALALAPADPTTLLPSAVTDRVPVPADGPGHEVVRHVTALVGAVAVVVLGIVWSLPFWLSTASGRSIGFLPDRSSMTALLTVHGAFAAVFAVYLLRHALPELDREHLGEVAVMTVLVVVFAWGGASAAAVALFGPMVVVGWILLRTQAGAIRRATATAADAGRSAVSDGGQALGASRTDAAVERVRDAVGYETVMLIAGAGIVVIVEFAYVKEQAGPGRLNTVFKTYADVWILWAVAAGAMLAHLIENRSPDLALTRGRWRTAVRVFAVLIVVSTALYGAFALSNHFSGDGFNPHAHTDNPTLDGFYWLEQEHADEAPAIAWFDSLEGQPNIASAPGTGGEMYRWTNPVSSLTGVPTLAGWAHEVGYRGGSVYRARVDDVESIYTGPVDRRAWLLSVYEVEYVYVGPNEREAYAPGDLKQFESMAGVELEKQWGNVRVYRVNQDELQVPSGES
ncbi:MAG: DUF2298 domain-containing protein [Haloarculaceae archaeon]